MGLFYCISFFLINLLVLLLSGNLLQIILIWQVFLISVFLRTFWRGSLTRLQFWVIPSCKLHISTGFLEFLHSLACLVPPPLVNLRLCHARLFWNFNDLLSRPKQIASSKLILEASQLLFCLALASMATPMPLWPNYGVFAILRDFSYPHFLLSVWGVRVGKRTCCWGQCGFISCALFRWLARNAVWLLMDHRLLGHHRQGLRGHHAALLLCSRSCLGHFLSLLGRAAPPNGALKRWFTLARRRLQVILIFSLNIGDCGGGWWGSAGVFSQIHWFSLRFWLGVTSFLGLLLSCTDEGLEATYEAPRGAIVEYTGPGPLGPSSCLAMEHLEEGRRLVNGLESRPESLHHRRGISILYLISILVLLKILLFWRLRRRKVGRQSLGCQLKGLSVLLQL